MYENRPSINVDELLLDKKRYQHTQSLPADRLTQEHISYLHQLAGRVLPNSIAKLIQQTPYPFMQAIFDYQLPIHDNNQIIFVGDAALTLRPHTSSGVVKALTNGIEFTDLIRNNKTECLGNLVKQWQIMQQSIGMEEISKARDMGTSLVVSPPNWDLMNQELMDAWWMKVMQGKNWYITPLSTGTKSSAALTTTSSHHLPRAPQPTLSKFNIALVPIKPHQAQFTNQATHGFSIKTAEYLLGENSLPHISLCHFEAEEMDIANIVEKVKELAISTVHLTFSAQRSKTYPDHPLWGKWSWVSLIPNKLEQLKALHLQIAQIVKPLNASFNDYDPHMTLFNSYDKERCNKLNESTCLSPALMGAFEIILGRLDAVGQITETLYHCGALKKSHYYQEELAQSTSYVEQHSPKNRSVFNFFHGHWFSRHALAPQQLHQEQLKKDVKAGHMNSSHTNYSFYLKCFIGGLTIISALALSHSFISASNSPRL